MNIPLLAVIAPTNSQIPPPSLGSMPSLTSLPQALQGALIPQVPQVAPAPLHDIVGPFSFFAYTPMQVIFTLVVFILFLFLLFFGIRKLRQKAPLTPREACLQSLLKIKENLMEGSDDSFGIFVSGLLRGYLGTAFGLAAPRQTTEEFLLSLRDHNRFTPMERESLEAFLVRSDFLKFAHGEASQSDRLSLIEAAEEFVRGEIVEQAPKTEEEVVS
ncbi:MAG: hypothetical protein QE493_04465 [Verrucomicrobiae bacterium]|nr:hypothetical protein [Verrucomicrobiae bacterium]